MEVVRDTWSWFSININIDVGIKNTIVSMLMIMIFMYSAMKISANAPLLYSVLKPETSSDSPSAKSKGVRLVSANVVVNQHMKRRGNRMSGGQARRYDMDVKVREWKITRGLNRINTMLTS